MARSADLIRSSLGQTVLAADPSADLAKGPVFDLMIAPVAPELAVTEQTVEDLRVLTSLQFDRVATEAEVNAIGTAFGLPPVNGLPARVRQTFWRNTPPDTDITIERGTLVGASDGSLVFAAIEQSTMVVNRSSAYYNAIRRRYEMVVRVEAAAIGTDSNLPAFRVTSMLTPVPGIDGTENREAATGGTDRQALAQYARRIRAKFLGPGDATGATIKSQAFEYAAGDITDIQLVYPADRQVFRRDTGRPAIDVVLVGTRDDSRVDRTIALGGETSVVLTRPPVLSVTDVSIDGSLSTAWAFVPDPSPALAGSARAQDRVVLTVPLTANQVVDVAYRYDALVQGLQAEQYDAGERQFGTDLLARRPVDVPVTVQLDVTVVPSFDENRATDAVATIVFDYIEVDRFVTSRLPETLVQSILDQVPGVSSVRLVRFTRARDGVLPVESVVLLKNELPSVDQATYSVRVHR